MPPEPRQPLPYEPPATVSRRSFRLLLLLTFSNTVMLALIVGPNLSVFVRQQWAEYQQRLAAQKENARQVAARQAYFPVQQKCMDFLVPPGTLLFAEDPQGIRELTTAGPVNHVCNCDWPADFPHVLSAPVGSSNPTFMAAMPRTIINVRDTFSLFDTSDLTLLYMHRCQTSAGFRLVAVCVSSDQAYHHRQSDFLGNFWNIGLTNRRRLVGVILSPETSTDDLAELDHVLLQLDAGGTLVTYPSVKNPTGKTTADYSGLLRLYAGQPDATDPAQFHIPYQYNKVHGTIDGVVTADDKVKLVPDPALASIEADAVAHPFEVADPYKRKATGKP